MQDIPADLKYATSHEWVLVESDELVRVGITEHAQSQLGDMVFVELPEPGTQVSSGDAVAVVESVKAASDVYSPVSGEIVEVNDALESSPELVNSDPYVDGWLFAVRPDSLDALDALLDAEGYRSLLEEEA